MKRKRLAAGILAALAGQANAFRFETSQDWEMRWDNTVKLNVMSRVAKQDKDAITPRAGAGWFLADDADHPADRRLSWASPSTPVGEYNHEAEDMHYAGGELLDAFVFANFDVGNTSIGIRAGRHTIFWGQGLLTNGPLHGVGGAMAPIDFNKALSVRGSEAKELFLPTSKISTVVQLTDNLTLNAYYSNEFQAYRCRCP